MKLKRLDDSIKRAALYTRVSTEEQALHGVSLDAQKERLTAYAKENALSVVDYYVDEGISARKRYTRRPEFMRMISDIKAGKIDVVLFIKLDRWFRNIADYYEVQAILDEHRVQWVATEEEYDTTTANGRLALNIKLAIAQDESDRTSERIKFVFGNMVKDGRVISGNTPLGFKIENKRAAIDEEKAPVVREAFDKYIDCRSMKETSRHIFSKYGVNIDAKSMKHMLTNTWYIGEAYGIEGWCPAIVDAKTFRLAQSLLETRGMRNGARTDRVYLFTGLVFCGLCGRRMTTYHNANKNPDGTPRQSFVYYRCPMRTMRQCDMCKQINETKLEEWLINNIRYEAERYNSEIKKKKASVTKKATDTSKIMAKIEKLKDLYLNDLIPREVYEKDYITLKTALEEAERQQRIVEEKPIDTAIFNDFETMYTALSPESRKAFWSRTLKKITVMQNGNFVISFNSI